MKFFTKIVFVIIILKNSCGLYAEGDSSKINKKRFYPLLGTVTAAYGGALIGLNELWYKGYPKSSFHFFNDNHEWLQIDKVGHAMTSFQESRLGVDLLKWSGLPEKKAIVYGSLAGFIFQTPIEILDGYSAQYGASAGDLAANTAGSALVLTQYLLWKELRIHMKYSFHRTVFSSMRPNTLGSNLAEELLKDYNGQTYWLSGNISSFLNKKSRFPKWLSLSLGYGGENMLYGKMDENRINGFNPYRQYYFSFDVDLQKIKTNRWLLKKIFYVVNVIKIPAPALEFNKNGIKFHPIYF